MNTFKPLLQLSNSIQCTLALSHICQQLKTGFTIHKNLSHNCPAYHQFDVNLLSWRLSVSELELTYDVTENIMIIDGHTLPCYYADGFCKPSTKPPFTFFWFSDDFCLIFTLQNYVGRMTKIDDRYWVETDSFNNHFSLPNKSDISFGIKFSSFPYLHAPHTQNQHNPSLSKLELFPHTQTFCGKPEPLHLHNTQIFLLHTKKVSICIQ